MLLFLVTWRTSLQISSKIPRICNLNLLKRAAEIFRDPGRDIIVDLKCTIFRRIFRRGPRFLQFQQLRTIPRKHGIVKLKSFETTDTLITDWRNVTKRHLLAWINKFHRNVVDSWADREPCQPFHEKFPRIYSSKRSSEIFTDGKTGGRFRSNFYKVLLAVRGDRNEYSGKLGREKKLGLILHEAITVRDKNIRFDEIHAFTEKGHGLWNIQERSKTCPGGRFKRTIS